MPSKQELLTILAFDPGTSNFGYSLLAGNISTSEVSVSKYFGVFKTNKWNKGDKKEEVPLRSRIDILGNHVKDLIVLTKPALITMEDFVEQGKHTGKTYKDMAYLTEHLRILCRSLDHEVTIYPNGIWKKKTLQARNASKIQVQHYIKYHVKGTEVLANEPDHVWDSVGIGYCRWLDYLKNRGSIDGATATNEPRRLLKRARVSAPKVVNR